ncbi:MAG: gliding motility-associated C-terminal domain-containing protein [Flavobacteriales bacterium]
MKGLIVIIWFSVMFSGLTAFSQFQNNNWRFGFGGGLIFDNVGSVVITTGQTNTQEGSSAISDRNTGVLLFYTDGINVWNANNEVMQNGTGLLGGTPELTSSTSAAAIVRDPNSETMYYIFTIDEQSSTNGLRYSIVDMTLDGGLGAIPTNLKNIPVYSTTSEKIQIIPNADQDGYWIITHDNQEALVAFELTQTGISTTPVISNITSPQFNGAGHFKMNRTFTKLAIGSLFESNISLFDFNNETGVFSNPVSWSYNFGTSLQYGMEFSPNGQVLYASNLEKIVQYDLSSNNATTIENSGFEVFVTNFLNGTPASMQLAPNNKIYVNNGGSVGVIECPNFLGSACNWIINGVAGAAFGGYGLHIWSYDIAEVNIEPSFEFEANDNCVQTPISFSFSIPIDFDELNILWGDGGEVVTATASALHTYDEAGSYTVNVEVIKGCEVLSFDSLFVVEDCNVDIVDFNLLGNVCDIESAISLQVPLTTTFDQVVINYGLVGGSSEEQIFSNISNTISSELEFIEPGIFEICVNYIVSGILDTTICETFEIGLCCDFQLVAENLCTETPTVLSVFGTNEISNVSWTITSGSGEIFELEGLQASANLQEEGNYFVSAVVNGECSDTLLSRTITVISCEKIFCDPFIPNVFTPNDDGINEFFTPVFSCEDADFNLKITNRWGEVIYDSGDTNRGWNGGINGYFVPDGVYIYEVAYQRSQVNRVVVSGSLTILR